MSEKTPNTHKPVPLDEGQLKHLCERVLIDHGPNCVYCFDANLLSEPWCLPYQLATQVKAILNGEFDQHVDG